MAEPRQPPTPQAGRSRARGSQPPTPRFRRAASAAAHPLKSLAYVGRARLTRVSVRMNAVHARDVPDQFASDVGPYFAVIRSTMREMLTTVRSWVPAPISSLPSTAHTRKKILRPSVPVTSA